MMNDILLVFLPFLFVLVALTFFNSIFPKVRGFMLKVLSNPYVCLGLIFFFSFSLGFKFNELSSALELSTILSFKQDFLINPILYITPLLILLGGAMNWTTMLLNGGKMPVYLSRAQIPKKKEKLHFYFNYKNIKKIRLFYFCDFIAVSKKYKPHRKNTGIFSLGDLLMFYGLTLYLLNLIGGKWLGMM